MDREAEVATKIIEKWIDEATVTKTSTVFNNKFKLLALNSSLDFNMSFSELEGHYLIDKNTVVQ